MKKLFLTALLLIAVMIICAACGKKQEVVSTSVEQTVVSVGTEAKTEESPAKEEDESLEIVTEYYFDGENINVPVSLDLEQFDKFETPVTITFDIEAVGSDEWFCVQLLNTLTEDNAYDMNRHAIDLEKYRGKRAEVSMKVWEGDISKFKKYGSVFVAGDGYGLYKITLSGKKNKAYFAQYENAQPLEICLDYPGGMAIENYDFSLTLNVDEFDKFFGPVTVSFDVDVAEDADWYSIDFMTAWEGSGFYDDLSEYSIDLYRSRGKNKVATIIFSEKDIKRFKEDGVLVICGAGYSLNSITLKGFENYGYAAPVAPEDSPVSLHGQLSIANGGFVDKNGEAYRLTGTAVGWDTLCPFLVHNETYSYLRDEWGINAIRIGMEAHSDNKKNGFMDPYVNWDYWLYYADNKIDTAISAGLYVVLDYHNYYNPLDTLEGAEKFFGHVAEKYAGCPNIIYEIGNEPDTGEWKHTKEYADKLIPLIRKYSPDAVIVCPSAGWASEIMNAYKDPLDYDNVIYTFHLYCNPFVANNYNDLKEVLENGFPVFLTEYNTCGVENEPNDYKSEAKWDALLSQYKVSYVYHNIMANYESYDCSEAIGLLPKVSALSGWTADDMGESMAYFYHKIRRDNGLE